MLYLMFCIAVTTIAGCIDLNFTTDSYAIDVIYGDNPFAMIYPSYNTSSTDEHYGCVYNPVVHKVNSRSLNSPYLYIVKTNWYIFYSHKLHSNKYSSIGCSVSVDFGDNWNDLGSVLKVPFDIRNPIVFMHEGQHFMMTSSNKHLQLFKSSITDKFPFEWEKVNDVLPLHYTNPSILHHDDTWWIFVNYDQDVVNSISNGVDTSNPKRMKDHLHILYSDSPVGPFRGHPNNCIYGPSDDNPGRHFVCLGGKSVARPHMTTSNTISSGKFLHYNNRIYRVSKQRRGLSIFEIVSLSKDEPMVDEFVAFVPDIVKHDANTFAFVDPSFVDFTRLVNIQTHSDWHPWVGLLLRTNTDVRQEHSRKCKIGPASSSFDTPLAVHKADASSVNNMLCFMTAVSSNHFKESLAHVESIRRLYPCSSIYVYDLGMEPSEREVLKRFGNISFLELKMSRPYVEFNGKAFKGPMFVDMINRVQAQRVPCGIISYGDAHTMMISKYDSRAITEVQKLGIVVEKAVQKWPQLAMTHPGMFPYFNVDRELEYKRLRSGNGMFQVQSGLMLIDPTNRTILELLFRPWSACCLDANCLSPGGVITERCPKTTSGLFRLKDGGSIYKCHRDDQSAFSFLIDRLFNRNAVSLRKVYLNSYMKANWRQKSNEENSLAFVRAHFNNLSCHIII